MEWHAAFRSCYLARALAARLHLDQGSRLPNILQETRTPNGGASATVSYVYGLGQIAATDSAGGTSYFLADGLGSTTQLASTTGAVTDSYTYDVFGAPRSQTGTTANDFRFTGQQQDSGANRGLLYLRARHYDPALGRFLSKDPLPLLQRYAYAGGEPVNLTDPSGLCWVRQSVCDAAKGVVRGEAKISGAIDYAVLESASIVVYAPYYTSYYTARAIDSLPPGVRAAIVASPQGQAFLAGLWVTQGISLGADVALDRIKNKVLGNKESVRDEGVPGCAVPTKVCDLIDNHTPFHDPTTYLPGWREADNSIDFSLGLGCDEHKLGRC